MSWLNDIEARATAATPGPWSMYPRNLYFFKKISDAGYVKDPEKFTNKCALSEEAQNGDFLGADIIGPIVPGRSTFVVRDAWFIAASRSDVPKLVACVRELSGRLNIAWEQLPTLEGVDIPILLKKWGLV